MIIDGVSCFPNEYIVDFLQVHKAYEGGPGCVVLNEKPLIVLAGDAFSQSTMDGCIESALCTKDALQKVLSTKSNI